MRMLRWAAVACAAGWALQLMGTVAWATPDLELYLAEDHSFGIYKPPGWKVRTEAYPKGRMIVVVDPANRMQVKAVFSMGAGAYYLGLGFIIGPRYASIICAGSFLSVFAIVPLLAHLDLSDLQQLNAACVAHKGPVESEPRFALPIEMAGEDPVAHTLGRRHGVGQDRRVLGKDEVDDVLDHDLLAGREIAELHGRAELRFLLLFPFLCLFLGNFFGFLLFLAVQEGEPAPVIGKSEGFYFFDAFFGARAELEQRQTALRLVVVLT